MNFSTKSFWFVSFRPLSYGSKCSQRYSIEFRSGLWDGHSKLRFFFYGKIFFSDFAVCFGSLSCWKFHLCRIIAFGWGNKTLLIMFLYIYWSMMPSMRWNRPTKSDLKHPHTMTLTPSSLRVGNWYFELNLHQLDVDHIWLHQIKTAKTSIYRYRESCDNLFLSYWDEASWTWLGQCGSWQKWDVYSQDAL